MATKIRLGISSCLLGERVRFDGGHQMDRFLTDILGKYVEYVPVCPEVECGFGVPREPFRLVGNPSSPRLLTARTKKDCTERMVKWARRRVVELDKQGLCGFIFKSGSPSSGMERVRVYDNNVVPVKRGVGVFARIFMERFPLLPVEEEGRLHDMKIRENFIERIFALKRWREVIEQGRQLATLIRFHTEQKLLIFSHSPKYAAAMGKLVAHAKELPPGEVYEKYQTLLMDALRLKATIKKHVNVLFHIMGFFKRDLSQDEKAELLEVIEDFRRGYIPLIVPITLLNHYVRKYKKEYLQKQCYLNPHPLELQLRNHV